MNRQTVTLRANDSINLTTGVVTRSYPSGSVDLPTAAARGLQRNNLHSLWLLIKIKA